MIPMQRVFDEIYRRHYWRSSGPGHSLSGPGSDFLQSRAAQSAILSTLSRMCGKRGVGQSCTVSMLDAACGDMTWMPLVLEAARKRGIWIDYTGVDVSAVVTRLNNASRVLRSRLRAATATFRFEQRDLTAHAPSRGYDLVLARHVFMHLTNEVRALQHAQPRFRPLGRIAPI